MLRLCEGVIDRVVPPIKLETLWVETCEDCNGDEYQVSFHAARRFLLAHSQDIYWNITVSLADQCFYDASNPGIPITDYSELRKALGY